MHHRGSEAANKPHAEARLRKRIKQIDILDQRKPRAHGKSHDGGIDHEADPVSREQIDERRGLQAFLDDGRDFLAVGREIQMQICDRKPVHFQRGPAQKHAREQGGRDLAKAYEAVTVEIEQRPEENQHRGERYRGFEKQVCRHHALRRIGARKITVFLATPESRGAIRRRSLCHTRWRKSSATSQPP